ncbi:MAG: SpoIIE family protein phosphatase [Lachnospiraceae bacterium]|nr:SpoIIE family protein phosphatase [Lachnospiraceae bacterium]
MRYQAFLYSHGGKVRQNNEDNAYLEGGYRQDDKEFIWTHQVEKEDQLLAAVFDGMGGEASGEVASRIAARSMYGMKTKKFSQSVADYTERASERILSYGGSASMGTTYVAASIEDDICYFSNVGDSRGYLYRDKVFRQMTRDHNLVQELYRNGILTKEQAQTHPDRHTLQQFLGMKEDGELILPEPYEADPLPVKPGDQILLCSDGLTEMLGEEEIINILNLSVAPEEKGKRLVEGALEKGGKDNVTVVVVSAVSKK